ncbi:uncharacterized protein LOC113343658 [Papaver somniferum]|uniref:uncharacterized protein LOC113343658 n=1 Tax=Papaver somniferum TaxID=3469 RepID=UPI000E6FFA1A|nr:uncharacterized protein LOC113343658 [Papaver somniferum]
MNQALLAKWCWRFGSEKSHLWYKLIAEKYGCSFSSWTPEKVYSAHGVSCWRTIVEAGALITANYSLSIHSGENTSFWHDIWRGELCLMDSFSNLYKLDKLKNASLADHITSDNSWKFDFKRTLTNDEVDSLAALLQVIDSTPPILDTLPDVTRWPLNSDETFSVKSLYSKVIREDGVANFPYDFVWVHGIPPKVNFFIMVCCPWKIKISRQIAIVDIDSSCSLYGDSTKSKDHILLHCKVSHKVWSSITPSESWAWFFPDSFFNLESTWYNTPFSGNAKVVWKLIPAAVVWVLWRERNCRVFEENYTYKLDEELCSDAKTLVLTWATAFGNKVHVNFAYTVKNWNIVFT